METVDNNEPPGTADEVLGGYRRWAYRLSYDMLPFGSPDVDDLAQEAYIAMWRALDTHDPGRVALPTWLTGAARMRMKDVARGHGQWTGHEAMRGRRPAEAAVSLDEADDPGAMLAAADLLEGVEWAYHRGEVARAISELTEPERLYIAARFWYGLDPTSRLPGMRELVEQVPVLAQRWHWQSAKKKLRERLAHLADA